MTRLTRILIVDDYPAVCADLRTLLELVGSFQVVGEASTAAEALHLARWMKPDVVLVDLDADRHRPHPIDNAALLPKIKALTPQAKIFALSTSGDLTSDLTGSVDEVFVKGTETDQLIHRMSFLDTRNKESTHDTHK